MNIIPLFCEVDNFFLAFGKYQTERQRAGLRDAFRVVSLCWVRGRFFPDGYRLFSRRVQIFNLHSYFRVEFF